MEYSAEMAALANVAYSPSPVGNLLPYLVHLMTECSMQISNAYENVQDHNLYILPLQARMDAKCDAPTTGDCDLFPSSVWCCLLPGPAAGSHPVETDPAVALPQMTRPSSLQPFISPSLNRARRRPISARVRV